MRVGDKVVKIKTWVPQYSGAKREINNYEVQTPACAKCFEAMAWIDDPNKEIL
jgi:hypothetical protein